MSTKTSLLTALDTFINAAGLVTKARHTDANELFVDEFYPIIYKENSLVPLDLVLTESIDLVYDLRFVKQGNKVSVSGNITNNNTNWATGNIEIFAFLDASYKPVNSNSLFNRQTFQSRNSVFAWADISGFGNAGLIATNIAPLTSVQINTFYFT